MKFENLIIVPRTCTVSTEAEFLDDIQAEVIRGFLLCFIHSHLYSFALSFYFFKLTQPLTVSTVQLQYTVKEENLIENHTTFPIV